MKKGLLYTFDEFDHLSADAQLRSLIVTSHYIPHNVTRDGNSKLSKVIDLLMNMNNQGGNYLFSTDQDDVSYFDDLNETELNNEVIEFLYSKNLLNSNAFENHLTNFDTVSIKLNYPSSSFVGIYGQLLNLKAKLSSRTKFVISVFISGISGTDHKFEHDTNVENIELDNTITSIQSNSFAGCSSLKQITIPSSITSVGDNIFSGCSSLKQIIIPSSVISLGKSAFEGLPSSTEIIFPAPNELENAYTLFYYGNLYDEGKVVEKNLEKAKEYYIRSAMLGNLNALDKINDQESLFFIGLLFYEGLLAEQNYTMAAKFFEKSAQLGNTDAMYKLGIIYLRGEGVEENNAKAIEYFEKSGKMDNPGLLNIIGTIYCRGDGVAKNYVKGKEYFERSAELGDSDALIKLCALYLQGEGV